MRLPKKLLSVMTYSLLSAGGLLTTTVIGTASAGMQNPSSPDATITATALEATLVKTISTASYAKPIPDPTGITYVASRHTFFITDSEVDETPLYAGTEIFEVSLGGELVGSWSSTAFGHDLTEIEAAPDDAHMYVTDDVARKIFVLVPGADEKYGTQDDVNARIDTTAFGSLDPEGIDFDSSQGHLLLLDNERMLYEISPGTNGVFDGIIPQGDDRVMPHDLSNISMSSLKGIMYNASNDHIYITGHPANKIAEVTLTGRLVQTISISATLPIEPSDLVFAPSSTNLAETHLYVTDRGQDNEFRADENDGRILELSVPLTAANHQSPEVSIGPDITVSLSNNTVQLSGKVKVDPSISLNNVTIQWAQLTGPTDVVFANKNTATTKATLSAIGSYVLRLLVDDGQLTSHDTMIVTVVSEDVKEQLRLPLVGNHGRPSTLP